MASSRTIVLVKLGGSLITDKRRPLTPRLDVMERVAGEIARSREQGDRLLVVGHGSGSFGHVAAARVDLSRGVETPEQLHGVSEIQDRAARLHRLLVEGLLKHGVRPFSLAPSSGMIAEGGEPVAWAEEPLRRALDLGLVPVTFGDVVLDRRLGACICSTETVLRHVALRLQEQGFAVERMIWVGETEGVWDEAGRRIPRIDTSNVERIVAATVGASGTDVTGGMRHRLETAWSLAGSGIPSLILDGRVPGLLERALSAGEADGTLVTR